MFIDFLQHSSDDGEEKNRARRAWGCDDVGRQVRKAFQLCETYCEQRGVSEEVARFNCVRSCVSPSCLETLYGEDPYELGEHDVRINSFRGCTSQDFSSGNRGLDTIRALLERDNIDAEAGSGASWNADYDEDDERERDRAEL
ncbi:hypothetical protein PTSG_04854 [Salpingoeca rosetta]|uniref:Uncharacterized protein n=1 Tax=Salpingoeca rosetta (strain ATCC 50818 / BSB-021) TaxID=946362 RepID=F2U9W4_SALR5|nr:uncharacterized protein PTSG_04854 [Salpingoeca rosetta]EGD73141.1 hypothetical protein PTSG_04854 [Salpingoeca rosetta]|eukprot:XP_004994172.1 hypothetical protein PTSG_04854 [Salpingoeca rosetta]